MKYYLLWASCILVSALYGQGNRLYFPKNLGAVIIQPLAVIMVAGAPGEIIEVLDGRGKRYVNKPMTAITEIVVGGALGSQRIRIVNAKGRLVDTLSFSVAVSTNIDDDGYYKKMFDLFNKGMEPDPLDGSEVRWNGKTYHYFVPWILDHCQTMKGLKYFKSYGAELVNLLRETQREDGMIYSFVQYMPNADYFLTRDKFSGYSKRIGDKVFVRQPTENHPEYLYVNTIYQCWKADGNDTWMRSNLNSAARALNYTLNDPARWSRRFGLLKRVYTIDSWDFAVEDEYLPDLGMTNSMIIDPVKSKFGVFFGDNTGYISACLELAEMYTHTGMLVDAKKFTDRAAEISDRLNRLSWNGKYFTHFIDEDSTVKRKLGVDEKSQIAQSNAYSLNRYISSIQSRAIIKTYLDLKDMLPAGSPGEWYAIYPPFQRGFGAHNQLWQYMNGGVGGHVAGELARGAYEQGYEVYGTDILNRLFELGKKYNNKIYFAYTGATVPPPPLPDFRPLDLSALANMDNTTEGGPGALPWMNNKRKGDDVAQLPAGQQIFSGIRFNIIAAEKNGRRSVIAVSRQDGFPATVDIPVNDTSACIYLLHTASKPASENVAATVTFYYADGSRKTNFIINGNQLTYWWFPQLKTDHSGIAWYGKNDVSEGVGLSWCAIDNPEPSKKIAKIELGAVDNHCIYTVFGISLSNQPHYIPVNPVSFGGPDNWAAATAMAALVEGLAGVKNGPLSEAYAHPVIAPRWMTTTADSVNVFIRLQANAGYVAYSFKQDKVKRRILLDATGSGQAYSFHILLPPGVEKPRSLLVNGQARNYTISKKESSIYTDFTVTDSGPSIIEIKY